MGVCATGAVRGVLHIVHMEEHAALLHAAHCTWGGCAAKLGLGLCTGPESLPEAVSACLDHLLLCWFIHSSSQCLPGVYGSGRSCLGKEQM